MRRLLDDEEPPRTKGERARAAALARYNWDLEKAKLLAVYAGLRGAAPARRAGAAQQRGAGAAEDRAAAPPEARE